MKKLLTVIAIVCALNSNAQKDSVKSPLQQPIAFALVGSQNAFETLIAMLNDPDEFSPNQRKEFMRWVMNYRPAETPANKEVPKAQSKK